jgi:hypothetical protein
LFAITEGEFKFLTPKTSIMPKMNRFVALEKA